MSETGVTSPNREGAPLSSAPGGQPEAGVPPDGLLEELDGSLIGPPWALSPPAVVSPAAPAISWRRGVVAATALTIVRPRLWVFALVAFLARGGLAALVVPIVVLPTFVGLANFVGPASVSAEGPGPRLVALVALGVATGLALAVAGTLVAAAAEVALHRATVAPGEPVEATSGAGRAGVAHWSGAAIAAARADDFAVQAVEAGAGGAVARIATLRLLLLVPLAAVAAAAVPAWIAVAYRELTLPSDVGAPLVARVLVGAPAATGAVLGTWLAAEVVGGFATRRAVLLGASIPRALAGGLLDPLRAPLGTALTVVAALAVSLAVLAPAGWAVGGAWDATRLALADRTDALAALGAVLLLAAAWLGVLAIAAIAAAWRATLVTMELLRRRR